MDAKTKKITVFLLCMLFLSLGAAEPQSEVYFPPGTPYLPQISEKLKQHDYELALDSLEADYRGELFYYSDNDSLRCEIQLTGDDGLPFVLDAFMTEPVGRQNVRSSLLKFSICLLILNAITSILFFVRSS
jgi:hypothetical protein